MGLVPIAGTSIFDLRASRRGYRLNKMCGSLCSPANREEFKRDEEAYLAKFGLSDDEKKLIRARDFAGMIDAGMNIYFMLKIGSVTGNSLYRMGAQMRGESYEQFLATRNFKDAVYDRRRAGPVPRAFGRRRLRPRQDADTCMEASVGRLHPSARVACTPRTRRRNRRLQRSRRRFHV